MVAIESNMRSRLSRLSPSPSSLRRMMMMLLLSLLTVGMHVRMAHGHGYVFSPPSRSCLCRERVNAESDCGSVMWEPQSVEGKHRFPVGGPADGELASGGVRRFAKLDRPSDRWHAIALHRSSDEVAAAANSVKIPFRWRLTVAHRSEGFRVFVTNERYNVSDHALRRDDLRFEARYVCGELIAKLNHTYTINCEFPRDAFLPGRQQAFLAIWDVGNNYNAFYQIIDFQMIFDNDDDGGGVGSDSGSSGGEGDAAGGGGDDEGDGDVDIAVTDATKVTSASTTTMSDGRFVVIRRRTDTGSGGNDDDENKNDNGGGDDNSDQAKREISRRERLSSQRPPTSSITINVSGNATANLQLIFLR